MGWFKTGSSRRQAPPSDLEQMWSSLLRGSWSSLAVVPADQGISAKVVTKALSEAVRAHGGGALAMIDATGASVAEGALLAKELASTIGAGSRAVVTVDSLMESLGGVALVRDVEAVLLVVRLGASNFDSVQSTIDIIGPGRILGSVALPREDWTDLAGAHVPPPASPEQTVHVSESVRVDDRVLVLNGAGVCIDSKNAGAYVGALYLAATSTNAAAIVAADEPKAIRMFFLRGDERERIIDSFRRGFERNSRDSVAEVGPKLGLLRASVPAQVTEGQVLSIVYVPGKGTSVGIENGAVSVVEGKSFADAIFRCWLGHQPDDPQLKDAMLGRPPESS